MGEGRRSVARNLPDRSPLAAATIVILLGLTIFGVLTSVYPIALFSTRSADKPIIPVWEPGDEEQTAEQTEDDTPTLSSAPTQIDTSGATEETDIDGWAREVVEAALREPVAQGPKKADEATKGGDDLPRAASYNPAGRPADPVLPQVESPSSENTITPSQDPALTSTAQHPDATAQLLPPQTSPPDSSTGTEASPQPSLTLPADNMGTTWQLPPDTPADTEAFPQPSAPPDETIPST
jgi:hypothetical protein